MQPRTILMLSYPFPPAAYAGVFRSLRFAQYLPEFGWKPVVLARSPEGLGGRTDASLDRCLSADTVVKYAPLINPYASAKRRAKAIFVRSDCWESSPDAGRSDQPENRRPASRKGVFRRTLRSLVSSIENWAGTPDACVGWVLPAVKTGRALIRQHQPLAIYSTGPPHSSHLAAILLKRLTGVPVVLDFRDPWGRPEWSGGGKTSFRQRLQCRLERICVRRADRVILNTPRLRDEFRRFYSDAPEDKFVAITNGYDPGLLSEVESLAKMDGPTDDARTIRICHPGSVYGRRSLKPLIAAVAQVMHTGRTIEIEQIGHVGEGWKLTECARELNVEWNLRLTPQLPHDETLRRMASADILAVIQPQTSTQVPGKLFEMLPFRKPILGLTEEGATADIIEQFGLGEVAPSDDSDAIASAITQLIGGQNDYPEAAGWDRAMCAFDGKRLTQELAVVLDELVG